MGKNNNRILKTNKTKQMIQNQLFLTHKRDKK